MGAREYWQGRANAAREEMSRDVDAAQSWAAIAKAARAEGRTNELALAKAAEWLRMAEDTLIRVQIYEGYARDCKPVLELVHSA